MSGGGGGGGGGGGWGGGGGEGLSAGSFSQSAAGSRALSNLKPGLFLVITN